MNIEKFVNINWYMKRKPYDIHSVADIFYLKICRKLFTIINGLAVKYGEDVELDEEDCRALAYVLTAYFEDVVNDIGFWKSVIDLNRKHFKKRLPFFDAKELEEEENNSDDIVSADIHYLLYINYVAMKNGEKEKEFIFFENIFFHEATESIYNYLADIEEVHTLPFYEKYLVPDEDYIDFKSKLGWFSLEGYITGIEFTLSMEEFSLKLREEKAENEIFAPFMYAEIDRLIFEQPSVMTAYTALDIFAGALHCSDRKKEEIRSTLKLRPHGIFHIQNENDTHITFLHTATGEKFNVLKNSFTNSPDAAQEEYWLTTFAKWNHDYYVSGSCLQSPYKGQEIVDFNLQMQHSVQKHYPPYREQIVKTALSFRNEAFRYFGKDLVEFSSGKEMQKGLDGFNKWYFENVTDTSRLDANAKPSQMEVPKEFITEKEATLFIPPGNSFEFIWIHKILLRLLQMSSPEKANFGDREYVTEPILSEGISKDYLWYIKQQYDLSNFSFFLQCNVDDEDDFEALLRIYKPIDFSALQLPRFKSFTSEKISSEGL